MITFEDFLNNKDYVKRFEIVCRQEYNSEKAYCIRKNMTIEDFQQNMYLKLLDKWSLYNDKYSVNTFTGTVIRNQTKNMVRDLNNEKNAIHSINEKMYVELDNDTDDNNFQIKDTNTHFDFYEAIEVILEHIPPQDRDICRMYLEGIPINQLQKFTDYSRKVLYNKMNKYKKIFQYGYYEYKAMLI